jgi:uncharacterized protein YbjT (DUF2867 family)
MVIEPEQYIILVSGATGTQGGAVARHLLKRGFHVRALTRNKESEAARRLADLGAEIAEGNFDDPSSLEKAFKSVYGAFSVQNTWKVGVEEEIKQGKEFADAAKKYAVKHFVYSSVGGAERNTRIPHFDSKWEIEEYVRSLNLPATILRPVFFMNNWLGMKDDIHKGKIVQPLSPETPLQEIAADDIGAIATIAFSDPDKWIGRAVEIAGDELTMMETAKVFSDAIGKKVEYIQIPWEDFAQNTVKENLVMLRWFEEKGYKADIASLRNEYPELRNLKTFLKEIKF